jgi:predicted DCC family thiol-disulfide oxidoreductase YuxK
MLWSQSCATWNDTLPVLGTFMVFDSDCILCSRWVQFILRHERDHSIVFVSAWSHEGQRLAAAHSLQPADLQRTYLVVEGNLGFTKSDAGIVLAGHLTSPARWLVWLKIVPRPLRDAIYDLVARNRYAWFGRSERCISPTPENKDRFVLD